MKPSHIVFQELFGGTGRKPAFNISWIPGLANTYTFKTNFLLSLHFLRLMRVGSLSFA
jgi:hypothetical protein